MLSAVERRLIRVAPCFCASKREMIASNGVALPPSESLARIRLVAIQHESGIKIEESEIADEKKRAGVERDGIGLDEATITANT